MTRNDRDEAFQSLGLSHEWRKKFDGLLWNAPHLAMSYRDGLWHVTCCLSPPFTHEDPRVALAMARASFPFLSDNLTPDSAPIRNRTPRAYWT